MACKEISSPGKSSEDEKIADITPSSGDEASAEANEPQPPRLSLIRRTWEWKPKPARYDLDDPPKFSLSLNLLFSFVGNRRRVLVLFSPTQHLTSK